MFGSFRLGRIRGIEISINYSLFLIGIFVVWQMTELLPRQVPGSDRTAHLIYGTISALLFFASILWHELAHALTAQWYKVRVRRIVLFFLGGIAEIEEEPRSPWQEFWIAFVGPLSSFVLGGLFWLGHILLPEASILRAVFGWLAGINLILALFNMIPAFPLDGARVVRAGLWGLTGNHLTGTRWVSYTGQVLGGLAIMIGIIGIFFPIFTSSSAFWNIFLGWFLMSSSKVHLHEAKRRNILRGTRIGELVGGAIPLKAEWSLAYAVDIIALGGPLRALPVFNGEHIVGVFSLELLRALPRIGWGAVRVESIMQPIHHIRTVEADMDIYDALTNVNLNNQRFLLVTHQHSPLGFLSQRELVAFAEKQLRTS